MKIAVHGATGRMGRTVVRLASEGEGMSVVGAIAAPGVPELGRDAGELAGIGLLGVSIDSDVSAGLLGADVVVDFSHPSALGRLLDAAARANVAVISGTTGLQIEGERLLDAAGQKIPVLWAPNTSFGIHVLADLAERAARQLGPEWDIEIVETHHRAKVDAPSGTALRLFDAVREARSAARRVSGRDGQVGARAEDEVGVLALRGGDVVGDHTVYLLGPGERIELTHRATSRDLFARGALRAARFLLGRPAGRYSLADVMGG